MNPEPSGADQIDVSVVIVTWNSGPVIDGCLDSLEAETGLKLQIIVVDNASADDTADRLARRPKATYVQTGGNRGFARAVNLGLALTRGRLIMLLNPDASLRPGALAALVGLLDDKPAVGAVGPRLIEANGQENRFAIRQTPSLANTILRRFGLAKLFPESPFFNRETLAGRDRTGGLVAPCLSGSALLFRRKVLDSVGFLDEELPMYLEDMDYCHRIRRSGWALYYQPRAEVVHLGAVSAEASPVRPLLWAAENGQAGYLFIRRYRGPFQAALFSAIIFTAGLGRWAVAGLTVALGKTGAGRKAAEARILVRWAISDKNQFTRRLRASFDLTD